MNYRRMSEHGAALQTYNQELVKCLEDLKGRRNDVIDVINKQEAERGILEKNLKALQEKLSILNNTLQNNKILCENYDRTIKETEAGFRKILETSQALLHVAQQEADKLENTVAEKNVMYLPQYAKENGFQ